MIASRHLGLLSVTLLAACVHAQKAPDKQANLAKLDAASKSFVNFQADVEQDAFTRLVKQTDKSTGKMYSIRGKGGDEIGIQIGTRTVHYQNGILKDFTAGLACYNTYSAWLSVPAARIWPRNGPSPTRVRRRSRWTESPRSLKNWTSCPSSRD